ncbi:aminotransferase class V-fold PLP-dependent enzyme [Sporomusa acidovorans]|uniref:Cysteine desulfurase n=1 Tax=Sporomusa acidovorans (strain ATCC 49682 / DSM 3132 / Mol) TaxID=1123286 RepID=A0ABZ3IZM1_SPOA4|nr:aminotransferase class V-fold PLP-dependent enzyme [Sporomusa acidovorans]OZC22282.1 cysteine desulfurase [Sporomusa acidovorans DSM 3132]SDF35520.1 Selenocysteine lyase/Cysteine desulfurase [Sporomusa acidovorans]
MKLIYLNNAATSWPKAPRVGETVADCINSVPYHAGRSGFSGPDISGECRKRLAGLLQVQDPKQIIFCPNATYALNIALHGIRWRPNAAIVTTAAEHNSVLRPLYYLSQTKGVAVHCVAVSTEGRIDPAEWDAALRIYQPQLAVFTHASNVTGAVNDAALLAGMAKQAGALTLLDVSQSLGLVPVLPEKWGVDLLAFTGHKYLLGPTGTGGLYMAPNVDLAPVWVGGTGVMSDLKEMPSLLPIRFEAGTPNDAAFAGLAAALLWNRENPVDVTELQSKTERLAAGLAAAGADVIAVRPPRTPVISFTLKNWTVEDAGEVLHKSFGIVCRTGLHCAPGIHSCLGTAPAGSVRISLSRFTTEEEINDCIRAIGDLVHAAL